MKYKIHDKYEGKEFWTRPEAPKGFCTTRNCDNCAKSEIVSTGPLKVVCNEVTEYTGLWDTGIPRGYSRQPFYVHARTTCDEHKFEHEMEDEED